MFVLGFSCKLPHVVEIASAYYIWDKMGVCYHTQFRVGGLHGTAAMAMVVYRVCRRKAACPHLHRYQSCGFQPYPRIRL